MHGKNHGLGIKKPSGNTCPIETNIYSLREYHTGQILHITGQEFEEGITKTFEVKASFSKEGIFSFFFKFHFSCLKKKLRSYQVVFLGYFNDNIL